MQTYKESIWKKDLLSSPVGMLFKRFVLPVIGMTFGLFVFNYSLTFSLEYRVLYPHMFSGLTICFFTIGCYLNQVPYRTVKGKRVGRFAILAMGGLMFASVVALILCSVWWNFIR